MPRSQSRTINPGPVGVRQPQFGMLLSFLDEPGRVLPRTLRVSMRMLMPGASEEDQSYLAQGLTSGMWWTQPSSEQWLLEAAQASMKIRTGSQKGIQRSVYADLREGEYNLPPCDSVILEVAYWRPGNSGQWEPIELFAEIADGGTYEGTPLTFTASKYHAHRQNPGTPIDSTLSVFCPVPPGAYAFEAAAGPNGLIAAGTDQQIAQQYRSPGFFVERSPQSGRWLPPSTPVMLGSQRRVYVSSTDVAMGEMWNPELTFFVR